MKKEPKSNTVWKEEEWYKNLQSEQKCVADLIHMRHGYYSKHDRTFRRIVYIFKILILFLSMLSTLVLGLKICFSDEIRVSIGFVFSTLTTFLTAIYSYFHFEDYWMRNVSIHIELNILRDTFIFDATAKKLDNQRLEFYTDRLEYLQKNNIEYWNNARQLLKTRKE